MKSHPSLPMFRLITNRSFYYILLLRFFLILETDLSQVAVKCKWWMIFIFFAPFLVFMQKLHVLKKKKFYPFISCKGIADCLLMF